MANSRLVLSFFTFFVIIQLSWCELVPTYDKDQGNKKFYDVGKHLHLSCKVTGADEKAKDIEWGKEGSEKLDETRIKVEGPISTFTIDKSVGDDDGTYFCKYKKEQYDFEAIANILVRIKPSTDVSVVEGESLILKCAGVGTKLKISWIFQTNVSEPEHVSYKDGEDGLENSTLEIKHVDKSYRGSYTCVGRHDASLYIDTNVTSTAYVRVKDKYAALWPFILICIEVFILCAIILIYEKHRTHVEVEDSETEPDQKNGKN